MDEIREIQREEPSGRNPSRFSRQLPALAGKQEMKSTAVQIRDVYTIANLPTQLSPTCVCDGWPLL
jgi:hypothetical protein